MKYVMLVAQGLADDPVGDLGGRTPLEAAKTPFMDLLAMRGRVGWVSFAPASLPASADVACFSVLGFDPSEYYTGLAPLEAAAMGLDTTDQEIVFRCDWVTVEGSRLVDVTTGISPTESLSLIQALNEKVSSEKIKFYTDNGRQNFLKIKDSAAAQALDELECKPPARLVGQPFMPHLPRGRAGKLIKELMKACRDILESSEINRVRIDLGENPANMIWPWGQGRIPKVPSFSQRYGLEGSVFSEAGFARGLGKILALSVCKNLTQAVTTSDFTFVYHGNGIFDFQRDLKSKIRWIEEFDSQVVGHVYKALARSKEWRLFVSTDLAQAASEKIPVHGPVPFLVSGSGFPAESVAFNEKNASQSRWRWNKGHEFMETFLK